MWLFLLLALLLLLLYLYSPFQSVSIFRDKWLSPHLILYKWTGKQYHISQQFQKIRKDSRQFFKFANPVALYYSLPADPVWECVLGFEVNCGENLGVAAFLDKYPEYKEVKLNSTRYAGCLFTYVNRLSCLLIPLKLNKFLELLRKQNIEPFGAVIERYHMIASYGKKIEIVNPTDNLDAWNKLHDI